MSDAFTTAEGSILGDRRRISHFLNDDTYDYALELKPDTDRIARAENFVEDGKLDVRRD